MTVRKEGDSKGPSSQKNEGLVQKKSHERIQTAEGIKRAFLKKKQQSKK